MSKINFDKIYDQIYADLIKLIPRNQLSTINQKTPTKDIYHPSSIDQIYKLGISVPKIRSLTNSIELFQDKKLKCEFFSHLWFCTDIFEMMSLAIYHFQHQKLLLTEGEYLIPWVEKVTCWQHSDELSKVYAHLVDLYSDHWYSILVTWNNSYNPWKRRQSIVSLIEYHRLRTNFLPFDKIITLIDNCIYDQNYYVQKAIGWTIREVYQVYNQKTIDYLLKNCVKISSIAFSTSCEKISVELKHQLKAIRAEHRLSNSNKSKK